MSKPTHIMVVTLAALAMLAGVVAAKTLGSKANQLRLKLALQKHIDGTLVSELDRNKQAYATLKLNPQQLRDLREKVYRFKQLDPDRQVDILEAAWDFLNLTEEQRKIYREREAWLRKVVASLTPEQREQLKGLSPEQRSKRLLEYRNKLAARRPATQPATRPAPTTVPAK